MDSNLNAGLDLLRGITTAATNAQVVRPVYSTSTPLNIPASGTVTSTISISDAFPIVQVGEQRLTTLVGSINNLTTSITVASNAGIPTTPFVIQIDSEQMLVTNATSTTWTVQRGYNNTGIASHLDASVVSLAGKFIQLELNINDGYIPDLQATLTSPDGKTVVDLFPTNTGNFGIQPFANFSNTVFDDSSTNPITLAGSPVTVGPYDPQTPLSVLTGLGSAGNWTLTITNTPSVLATLNGAVNSKTAPTITVTTQANALPATPFVIQVDSEQMLVTATTPTTWTVQRGYNGTTAATHATNASAIVIMGGTLTHWELHLPRATPGSGLGEKVADQIFASFRIFTQSSINPQSSTQWTPVGPAANNNGNNSGRIGGLAVDPSDPSGNTVFVAGASGGVWKTTDFLTTDPNGPTYVPLTDLGPTFSLNIGSLAVFARNNDPTKSVVFAATGEGSVGSPGVGFLRSMDGGATWDVLDSTNNVYNSTNGGTTTQGLPNTDGNILPMESPGRDHKFAGTTSFKVVVDPTPLPNGNIIVYAAMSGANGGGLWRSLDGGNTWVRLSEKIGNVTSTFTNVTNVVLAPASLDVNGNETILYAAVEGQGVFMTKSANGLTPPVLTLMVGGGTSTPRVADDKAGMPEIPTLPPASTPNGAKGRIVLATPVATNNPLEDTFLEGWLYAAVVTTTGTLDGLYLTKDFGLNWTKLNLPTFATPGALGAVGTAFPTNNETDPSYNPLGGAMFAQGNYDISLAVDPNNPNITYLGGSADGTPLPTSGFIRVDATKLSDPYNLNGFSNNEVAGGVQFSTTGPTTVAGPGYGILTAGVDGQDIDQPGNTDATEPDADDYHGAYLNLYREPDNPFVSPSTLHFVGVTNFGNDGTDVSWMPFDAALDGSTDQHQLIAMRDPLTGLTRLIFGDDQGVFTGVTLPDGTLVQSVGTDQVPTGSRNGNLQITQFYYGASQPSTLAANLASTLFYGMAQDNGFPVSDPNILTNGNLNWTGPTGDGTGVATDQTGSGTAYQYEWPCCLSGEGPGGGSTCPRPTSSWSPPPVRPRSAAPAAWSRRATTPALASASGRSPAAPTSPSTCTTRRPSPSVPRPAASSSRPGRTPAVRASSGRPSPSRANWTAPTRQPKRSVPRSTQASARRTTTSTWAPRAATSTSPPTRAACGRTSPPAWTAAPSRKS